MKMNLKKNIEIEMILLDASNNKMILQDNTIFVGDQFLIEIRTTEKSDYFIVLIKYKFIFIYFL
jgi:hypothetical protein